MATTIQKFKNNAASSLNGTLAIGGTTINLPSGHGNRFPAPSAGEYTYVTLYEKDGGGEEINYEIVKVTGITGDTMTVVRDIEGLVVAAGGTSGGWAFPSAVGVNPSQVVYIEQRYTAYAANNNLTKDGNLTGLESNATARTNLGLGTMATQNANNVTITGGTITGATTITDAMLLVDDVDPTKKMQFQLSTVGTGLTRTLTVPNNDITLAGTNVAQTFAADQTFTANTDVATVKQGTNSAASKATPVDADLLPITDSAASFGLKSLTWTNLKETLKTYFDSLATTLTNKTIVVANNTITTAASGNLAATDLNSALSELQADIDTRATFSEISGHVNSTSNPHAVTKTQVGLGNVDNTSDANKPVSLATQAAIDLKDTQGQAVRMNPSTLTEDLTIPAGYNALSAGPLTVSEGVEITLADNANWTIA